jgi:hypothetical protein
MSPTKGGAERGQGQYPGRSKPSQQLSEWGFRVRGMNGQAPWTLLNFLDTLHHKPQTNPAHIKKIISPKFNAIKSPLNISIFIKASVNMKTQMIRGEISNQDGFRSFSEGFSATTAAVGGFVVSLARTVLKINATMIMSTKPNNAQMR